MLDRTLPQPVVTAIEATNIPPLPQALVRLIRQIDDEASTVEALAAIIGQDPGLCARSLTAANSVAFHRHTTFTDIKSCVTVLGTRLIRSMATCLAVKRLFEPDSETVTTDLAAFWRHALLVAELARALAVATRYPHPDEAYLAGLMHDAGQLLLLVSLDEKYAWLLSQSTGEDQLSGLERASLSTDHAEVGAWLAEQWRLDSAVADAILFHHADATEIVTASMLPRLVWFADALARDVAALGPAETVAQDLFGPDVRLDIERMLARALDHIEVVATAMGLGRRDADADAATSTLPTVTILDAARRRSDADRELERSIADMAVMHPLQQDLFSLASETELLLSLRESARILFELPHMGVLLLDRDSGVLSGESIADQPAIFRQTRLAHGIEAGLATRALGRRSVCASFDEPPSPETLLDRQLARAFVSEGILAVPMVGRMRTIGVMLFALTRAQYPRIKARSPWLLNFGRIGGLSLEAWQDAVAYRKQAEDEAAAAFHRQARRIVHEAGNPLGIIKSYLRILDKKLPEDSEVRHEIDVLREEIDRVTGIVRRMSEVPSANVPSQVRVPELVRELLALYGPPLFADKEISVTTQLAEDAGPIDCDPDSLKQILVNLMKNASEAMPDGGRFDIQVFDGVVHDGRRHVELRLQDSGPGMPESALLALSHPEQSNSRGERGHGLSIVATLAARVGCKITCRSKAQAGTTISLLLPCVQES